MAKKQDDFYKKFITYFIDYLVYFNFALNFQKILSQIEYNL